MERNIERMKRTFQQPFSPFLIRRIWAGAMYTRYLPPNAFVCWLTKGEKNTKFPPSTDVAATIILSFFYHRQLSSNDSDGCQSTEGIMLEIKLHWKPYPLCKPRKNPELQRVRGT